MSKATVKHIGRRALFKAGAAIATAGTVAGVPTIAAAMARDPILDMIDRIERLRAVAKEKSAKLHAIADAHGIESGHPRLDPTRPEFREMAEWLARHEWWKPAIGIDGALIQSFNEKQLGDRLFNEGNTSLLTSLLSPAFNRFNDKAGLERALLEALERVRQLDFDANAKREAEITAECEAEAEARFAWLDQANATQDAKKAATPDYHRLGEEVDAAWDEVGDLEADLCDARPVTIEGAMAQLGFVAEMLRGDAEEDGGEEVLDIDKRATLRAYDALARLLGKEEVRS